jgi:hypothetical protein
MSELGLGCVKTQRRSIAIEEIIRLRPLWSSNLQANSTKAVLPALKCDFRFTLESGLKSDIAPCPKSASRRQISVAAVQVVSTAMNWSSMIRSPAPAISPQ